MRKNRFIKFYALWFNLKLTKVNGKTPLVFHGWFRSYQKEFLFAVQCLFKKQMILKAQQYSVANTECCGVQV